MAGSWRHCLADDGQLLVPGELAGMLENGGDVWEAFEQVYGMLWWLASAVTSGAEPAALLERAAELYRDGLMMSPGTEGRLAPELDDPDEVWLNGTQAAGILGVHVNSVRNWAESGKLRAAPLPSGVRRYALSVVLKLRDQQAQEAADG